MQLVFVLHESHKVMCSRGWKGNRNSSKRGTIIFFSLLFVQSRVVHELFLQSITISAWYRKKAVTFPEPQTDKQYMLRCYYTGVWKLFSTDVYPAANVFSRNLFKYWCRNNLSQASSVDELPGPITQSLQSVKQTLCSAPSPSDQTSERLECRHIPFLISPESSNSAMEKQCWMLSHIQGSEAV